MDNWDPTRRTAQARDDPRRRSRVPRGRPRPALAAGRCRHLDLALKGKTATIAAIEQDFEDRIHLAVTVDDDPGHDLGAQGKPGHRFFFRPEEVEPLDDAEIEEPDHAAAHPDRRHRQHLPGRRCVRRRGRAAAGRTDRCPRVSAWSTSASAAST